MCVWGIIGKYNRLHEKKMVKDVEECRQPKVITGVTPGFSSLISIKLNHLF